MDRTTLHELTGQVALVSGASRGIGEAIAKVLAAYGAHVIVCSRKLEGCQAIADAILAEGGSAEALRCHIGNIDDIQRAIGHVRETHGKLDILVNNAATSPYYGPILDTDLAAFEKTVEVNIRGYFFMSIEAGKLMRERGSGVIVNTASVNALVPVEMQGIYSISKAAVVSMTRAFAKECAQFGIRCNALLPGLTKTRLAGALFEDEAVYEQGLRTIPMRRHAEPAEMAGAVLYLVSPASSFTTGACLVVDGGQTI